MRIYRYFNQAEYDAYMAGDLKRVARQLDQTTKIGGEVCLKFFKNIRDIDVLRLATARDASNRYVGVFDIPMSMIRKVSPATQYPVSGYDVDYQTIKELAVPVFKIKPEFFTAVIDDKARTKTSAEMMQEIYALTSQSQPQ
jgi:hypothetical protein